MNTSCQHSVYAIRGSVIILRIVARSNVFVFRQGSSPQTLTAHTLIRWQQWQKKIKTEVQLIEEVKIIGSKYSLHYDFHKSHRNT